MQIHNGLQSLSSPIRRSSVAIGRFDGVHIGHQALIRGAVQCAHNNEVPSVVFTFDRHPAELLAPERAPGALTTMTRQAELLEHLGADHLVIAEFDRQFSSLSHETFMHFVLAGMLGAQDVFVGEDFRFGSGQSGNVSALMDAGSRLGFQTNIVPAVKVAGEKASSTRARNQILCGEMEQAAAILGRPHRLSGTVVHGQQLGRTLGFPTANLQVEGRLVVPANGIYAVRVYVGGQSHMGACSIGTRPTVDGIGRTVETFILDFDADIYGKQIDVDFILRLRDELKFDSLDDLVSQMHRDVLECRALLSLS